MSRLLTRSGKTARTPTFIRPLSAVAHPPPRAPPIREIGLKVLGLSYWYRLELLNYLYGCFMRAQLESAQSHSDRPTTGEIPYKAGIACTRFRAGALFALQSICCMWLVRARSSCDHWDPDRRRLLPNCLSKTTRDEGCRPMSACHGILLEQELMDYDPCQVFRLHTR